VTLSVVVGLGRSGVALARFLGDRGDLVRVCDSKPADGLQDRLALLPAGVDLRLGGYDDAALDGADAVYASPGVPWHGSFLEAARARGLPVGSEMDLFFRSCPAPIVGITGTNGKTTTTALTGAVLARGDRPVLVGGNIGETVLDRLKEVTPEHWVVLELSSFQLETVARPSPAIAVILNLTPDHLDRHGTMSAYVAAKARLIEYQEATDNALLNGGDAIVRGLAERTRATVTWFDEEPEPPIRIPGRHNLENAKAAAAAGRLAGIPAAQVNAAIESFGGVEHRLELVGRWAGVEWYNDSKATNPDAAAVGLESFSGRPLVLIAGGQGSGFELGRWLALIRAIAAAVVLIGESADLLAAALEGDVPVHRADGIEAAVAAAAGLASPGGVVLLSPGYKSYDMFESYEDRGRQFKAAVADLHAGRLA